MVSSTLESMKRLLTQKLGTQFRHLVGQWLTIQIGKSLKAITNQIDAYQAIFDGIRVNDDLTLFEQYLRNLQDKQSESLAQKTLLDFVRTLKTKTHSKILNFFTMGLSKDCLVRPAGVEPTTY